MPRPRKRADALAIEEAAFTEAATHLIREVAAHRRPSGLYDADVNPLRLGERWLNPSLADLRRQARGVVRLRRALGLESDRCLAAAFLDGLEELRAPPGVGRPRPSAPAIAARMLARGSPDG